VMFIKFVYLFRFYAN